MSVNTMTFEQSASFLTALYTEETGKQPTLQVSNTADFTTVGTELLQLGYDPIIDAGFSADEIRALQTNKEDVKTDASTSKDESVAEKSEVKTEVPDNVKELGDAVKNLNDKEVIK